MHIKKFNDKHKRDVWYYRNNIILKKFGFKIVIRNPEYRSQLINKSG